MSTIKSSDEHLTLNADGSGKSVKFQANGVEKASISSAGVMTATSFAGNADDLHIKSPTGENMIKCVKDAQVNLYYNNATKLSTSSTGVTVTGGVALGGTGAANTLDDYEEGTWTPVVKDDAGNTSPSITHNYSTYTKIGRMVTLTTELSSISSSGLNSVGDVRVYGLPFTVTTFGIGAVNMENVDYKDTFTDTESVTTIAMDTFVYFRVNRNNGGSQGLEGGDLNSGSSGFSFTVTYFV